MSAFDHLHVADSPCLTAIPVPTWDRKGTRKFCTSYTEDYNCCTNAPSEPPSSCDSSDQECSRSKTCDSAESTESDADSEKSHTFHVRLSTTKAWTTPLDRYEEKVRALARHMRSRPLLPPHPLDATQDWTDVDSGILFPKSHCAFSGCAHLPTTPVGLGKHLAEDHRDLFREVVGPTDFRRAIEREWLMSFYVAAIRHIERARMPAHGVSIDRRTLSLTTDEYNSDRIRSLICFCCAQIHTSWIGNDVTKFLHHFPRTEIGLFQANALFRAMKQSGETFKFAFEEHSFREQYMAPGSALSRDPYLTTTSWEWRQTLLLPDERRVKIICCPEDVHRCTPDTHARHEVCKDCAIPLCHRCHLRLDKGVPIPWHSRITTTWDTAPRHL